MHEYSPAKSPPNPRELYPPTLKICDPSLGESLVIAIIYKLIEAYIDVGRGGGYLFFYEGVVS